MKEEKDFSLQKTIDALVTLHDKSGKHFDESGNIPLDNSIAKTELDDFYNPDLLKTAYAQGSVLVEVAADHMIAFTRTITEPVLTISSFTCVRVILESGAIASWLLDPKIARKIHVQRSFAFRYEGLIQQVKFNRSTGDENKIKDAIFRVDEVEGKALEIGFERVLNKNGKRIGIAMQMLSTTQLVNEVFKEESSYRLLSAIAHAHPWALQQMSFQKTNIGNNLFLEKNLDTIAVWYLCSTAGKALVKAIWYKNQIFGWRREPLVNLFNYVYDTLGMKKQSDRFWTNLNPACPDCT